MRVGVLASGAGTNLQALLDAEDVDVAAVASDVPEAPALARAQRAGVPTHVFPLAPSLEPTGAEEAIGLVLARPAGRPPRDGRMAAWLREQGAELAVLAGYMKLLDPAFLAAFPAGVINVHPALLPAFPGLHAVEQALAYGVKVFGVTVHFVDEGVDTGPIVLQRAVELPGAHEPGEVMAALRPLEHALLPEAVRLIAHGAVHRDPDHPRRVLVSH